MAEKLKYFVNGQFRESKTDKWYDLHNPSTGEITGQAPCCTNDEVLEAIAAAKAAYPGWSATPAIKRAQILYRVRELILERMDELTMSVAKENGKVWAESEGDVLKAKEGTELATQVPSLMMGESIMDASRGYDTVKYREPLGVFAGIVPVNFPAMIPFGWMAPTCIAAGNTLVLKAASLTPKTAMLFAQLYKDAGVPDGVFYVFYRSSNEINTILEHPDVKGITFVGSTPVGLKIYEKAAANGKRCQALCQAKNHALVMEDCALERTVAGVINSAFGCAGQRCMALSCCVVQDSIADAFVAELKKQAELVTANIYRMKKGDRELRCEDYYEPDCPEIVIPLDVLKTPQQNAAAMYKEYNKLKAAKEHLTVLVAQGEAQLDYLNSVMSELQCAESEKDLADIRLELISSGYDRKAKAVKKERLRPQQPLRFVTDDGLEVLVGRSNIQNDELTTKLARRTDYWLHTQKVHGSHVILRCDGLEPPQRSIEQAACIAAYYSQGRDSGKLPVDYTMVRFVRKPSGSLPGKVIYTDYRTIIIEGDESLVERLRVKK